jgi:hypothetical protein
MMNCREVTQLLSERLDRDLPWRQRIGIYLHFIICRYCVRYWRHLSYIRRLIRLRRERFEEPPASDDAPRLSPEARRRIREALAGE